MKCKFYLEIQIGTCTLFRTACVVIHFVWGFYRIFWSWRQIDYLVILKLAKLPDRQDVRWFSRWQCAKGQEAPSWTCLDPIQAMSPPPLPVFLIVYGEGQKHQRNRVNFLVAQTCWEMYKARCIDAGGKREQSFCSLTAQGNSFQMVS